MTRRDLARQAAAPDVESDDRAADPTPEESQLRAIIDASPVAISVATRAGENLLCNPRFASMLGFVDQDEFRRTDAHELYADPEIRRRMKEALYATGETRETEVQFRHRDGRIVECLLSSTLFTFEGRAAHLTWAYDVTERKRVEQELRAEKARTEAALAALVTAQAALVERTEALAREIAERRQAQADLERLATTDPLTQLANRRQFFAVAERELARLNRTPGAAAVLMLDIDFFKAVNDTHGHVVGDRVLQAVATAGRRALRDVDLLARLGGEEFAALLPDTSRADAHATAERLRAAIARLSIDPRTGAPPLTVTVSVGVAAFDPGAPDLADALRRADDALYAAKRGGRNRTVVDGAPPADGEQHGTAI
jgi:diguanylate cyclase (GGDEF)-like protein/PAS domain S-box-containing protein